MFESDLLCLLFFFVKQKTAYEMRISDWSSDVCSSDLLGRGNHPLGSAARQIVGIGIVGQIAGHERCEVYSRRDCGQDPIPIGGSARHVDHRRGEVGGKSVG